MNENKQTIINAIWANPAPAFGCTFHPSGRYFENDRGGDYAERGKIRIAQTRNGDNIRVFYNGSSREDNTDVFTYLQTYVLDTANFADTLAVLAERYNVTLDIPQTTRDALRRGELAREVFPALREALRMNPNGDAARYITQVRGLSIDGVHFGELTADSIKRAKTDLQNRGKRYAADDWNALGLTEARARQGYNVVIPYYLNGVIQGYIYRDARANPTKDAPRYLYSEGLGRGGYCDRLTPHAPAVVVEGQLDAVRLLQIGITNVIAVGGSAIGDDIARLLRAWNLSEITYIPDAETDEHGHRKTQIITDAIKKLQTATVDGEPVIKRLLLADLPTPTGPNMKTDADSYGRTNPDALRGLVELGAVDAWRWELDALTDQATNQEQATHRAPVAEVRERVTDIYSRNASPFARQMIRDHVAGVDILRRCGVTPEALADWDAWNQGREYQNRVKQAAADLNKAVQEQANPETVGAIVRRLSEAQATNTRAEWDAQLQQTFTADLDEIRNQPPTLKTRWELGNVVKDERNPGGRFVKLSQIEFYPADIAVFCAPTSHGKTMVLFEAALDLVRADLANAPHTPKQYLFVSCEESRRQLTERALNVWLDIPTTDTGREPAGPTVGTGGGYCFIRNTRKRAIKAVLTGAQAPNAYAGYMGVSEHFEALKTAILRGVETYGREVAPRLKFVHTEASAESITDNIRRFVDDSRAAGVEVGAVFVDYMQLLTTDGRTYSRHDELKDICKALKDCAARTELPFILAAQLNREAIRNTPTGAGLDNVTLANIGEGADIERIAHDVFLVWQTDKTPLQWYAKAPAKGDAAPITDAEPVPDGAKICAGVRSRRLWEKSTNQAGTADVWTLKRGTLYIEQMKARDGLTGCWGLFPVDAERGKIGEVLK